MRVYLDHNATTPLHEKVREKASQNLNFWGNPSSIHWAGREAKNILRETRAILAAQLGCQPLEIIFNSGGSEGNNTVIKSVWSQRSMTRNHFLCSQVEHPSVMKTYEYLQSLGAKVDFIPVSRNGELDLDFIRAHLTDKTALISVMIANNETGHIFPIQEVVRLAGATGTLVHVDAVQALGKMPFHLQELGVNYATFSAHKFYSLKGTGFTFVKRGSAYESLIHGGAQERHRRGGTENVFGISALGIVAPLLKDVLIKSSQVRKLRDDFENKLLQLIPHVHVIGSDTDRLSNTSSFLVDGADGETLLMSLDLKGFAISTGAACSSGNPEPSPVLLAMGFSRLQAQTSLRVSFGWENTSEEVDAFLVALVAVVQRLRGLREQRRVETHV